MGGWRGRWMDGWMDEQVNGWMDGWMDGEGVRLALYACVLCLILEPRKQIIFQKQILKIACPRSHNVSHSVGMLSRGRA